MLLSRKTHVNTIVDIKVVVAYKTYQQQKQSLQLKYARVHTKIAVEYNFATKVLSESFKEVFFGLLKCIVLYCQGFLSMH